MKVVIVSFFYDEKLSTEPELLQQHYTTTGWAEALQRKGAEVIVINRFHTDSCIYENNVQHLFIKDRFRGSFKGWQVPLQFLKKICALNADVIHLHHLTLSLQTFLLRFLLNKKTAIIVQHHGGKAPGRFKRMLHNGIIRLADGFFFTSFKQGEEWFSKKKFRKIMPVMEGATFFNYTDRNTTKHSSYIDRYKAREITGLVGSPVFLWVGRLDENKDPLTVLEGFKIVLQKHPGSRLYMIYSDRELLDAVNEKINNSSVLKASVQLLGKINHEEIEAYYNSTDYFVSGSHYEGSGYALSEALRCGCIPVITNIPSFRMMTNNGILGALWKTGDKYSFAEAVFSAMNKSRHAEANACIDFFNTNLSFDSIAKTAINHYEKVITLRLKRTVNQITAGQYA